MTLKRAITAGHICLDITPDLSASPEGEFGSLLRPGQMVRAGNVILRAGGAAANSGLALHKLGVPVQLIGKIGDDLFGSAIKEYIEDQGAGLANHLVVDPSASTSYTIIINPPCFDRAFIHFQGANDGFYASDLPKVTLQQSDLFHFGYPTLMRSVYRGEGAELISILQRARRSGLTTSLDVSFPDPTSEAGKADWRSILANSLPWVDIFSPNAAELTFMLEKDTYKKLSTGSATAFLEAVDPGLLHQLSEQLLAWGVKIVLIKLGERGIYLRTADQRAWAKGGRGLSDLGVEWYARELWMPAFKVDVKGTTGAGDSATAGFLASLLYGDSPEQAMLTGAGAGALSVEGADATGGLCSFEKILERIQQGWERYPLDL
jgi:sugar/nucleoside kinase (ribokinase family)